MPEIRIKQEVDVDVNIDVYCAVCGHGICEETIVDNRRLSFSVSCSNCIRNYESRIEDLESEIEKLKEEACVYHRRIDEG